MAEAPNPGDQPPLEKNPSANPSETAATPTPPQKSEETLPAPKKMKKSSKEEGGKRTSRSESRDEPDKSHDKKHKIHRGELKFGEKPHPPSVAHSRSQEQPQPLQQQPLQQQERTPIDPNDFERMTAIYFHHDNDLSRSARGVGYTPDQAVPKHGPGVTAEVEHLYGPCTLLTDFKYSTWTETVVPLRNHNVVQGFNEMILFLMKLAADPQGQVNHEEAFMATSFLSNIRNDLGEHPPNVLALLEYIDYKTRHDGTEPADPGYEVLSQCDAIKRY